MLEHITSVAIIAQDIIQGKPWACQRLKIFDVMIYLELSDENHAQEGKRTGIKYTKDYRSQCHQIFERLGQLKQLTELDMRLKDVVLGRVLTKRSSSLPLNLRMGLRHLWTLRKLEMIGYQGPQEIRLADMEWMLEHWKNLRYFSGHDLSMKCYNNLEGVPDDRLRLVMETLKARQVQLNYYPICERLEIVYCSENESESEGEVDDV
jgi:hypothetical protein